MKKFDLADFRQKALPTEEQIMADWTGSPDQPVASVICTTFNQVDYIEDAIRGYLLQRTDFPFEILLHDDASTDGTAEIVASYQKRYPRIVRAILQKKNLYSQGVQIFLIPAREARGQYLALCDGDDFWIDEEKLALQVNALRANRECRICFHKTRHALNRKSSLERQSLRGWLRQRAIYPRRPAIVRTNAVIIGDGAYIPTASIVVTRETLLGLPAWQAACPVGDFFIQVLGSHPTGALFIPRSMSAYRINATGSWSSTTYSSPEKAAAFYSGMTAGLQAMDRHFDGQYAFEIGLLTRLLIARWQHDTPPATAAASHRPSSWLGQLRERASARLHGIRTFSVFLLYTLIQHIVLARYTIGARPARRSLPEPAARADALAGLQPDEHWPVDPGHPKGLLK